MKRNSTARRFEAAAAGGVGVVDDAFVIVVALLLRLTICRRAAFGQLPLMTFPQGQRDLSAGYERPPGMSIDMSEVHVE